MPYSAEMHLKMLFPVVFLLTITVLLSSSAVFAQEYKQVDVTEQKLVTLIGSGFDEDNDELTFLWVQIDGPQNRKINSRALGVEIRAPKKNVNPVRLSMFYPSSFPPASERRASGMPFPRGIPYFFYWMNTI